MICYPTNTVQDFAKDNYGPLPLNQSQSRPRIPRAEITALSKRVGENVLVRARVQTSRAQGSKMVFLNLRQKTDSIQALLVLTPEKISKQMLKWAAGLADESIVLLEGTVEKTAEPIKSATISDVELHVSKVRDALLALIRKSDNSPVASSNRRIRRSLAVLCGRRLTSLRP
jgi:aspartyl/asparaginyl-tRNA synthetase